MQLINDHRKTRLFDVGTMCWITAAHIPEMLRTRLAPVDFQNYLNSMESQAKVAPIAGVVAIPGRTIWHLEDGSFNYVSSIVPHPAGPDPVG